MRSDNSNVIDFNSLKIALSEVEPLTKAPLNMQRNCRHKKREVSLRERFIRCRDCGCDLDPITVLNEIANEYSGWAVKKLKDRLAEIEKLVKKIEAKRRTDLMTEEELAMDTLKWRAAHKCDPERMWRKGDMIHCYCGSSFNRHAFPKRALEVYKAHERLARKAKFTLKKWD